MSEVKSWTPAIGDSVQGTYHREGGHKHAVRTSDGTIWLFPREADGYLLALDPHEDAPVHVSYDGPDARGVEMYRPVVEL